MTTKNLTHKYLEKWCDSAVRSQKLDFLIKDKSWDHLISIPVRAESLTLKKTLDSIGESTLAQAHKLLVVLILNVSSDSSELDLNSHSACKTELGIQESVQLINYPRGFDILAFCFDGENAFLPKMGVGRARKIGGDFAVKLKHSRGLKSSYYFSTDADVIWPHKISIEDFPSSFATLCLPFKHLPSENSWQAKAIAHYDSYLREHFQGLKKARSPYAFFTLGSNLVIDLEAYVKVRGFPIRNAGEDFYFLNKAAKVGFVSNQTNQTPIMLSGRASNRVPFGTGASVTAISERLRQNLPYRVYNPVIYEELEVLLTQLKELAFNGELQSFLDSRTYDRRFWANLKHPLQNIIKNTKSAETRRKALDDYFDSFLTLKWIHYLSETQYPKVIKSLCVENPLC